MKAISHLIIGNENGNTEKRNIIWNMIGSFIYAFASMVLSIAVVRIAGEDAGGIFNFAFPTFGQHMFMVAYFGIRPFQITDTGNRYTFGEYRGLRYYTCAFAIVVALFYVGMNSYRYSMEKSLTIMLLVLYKVIDALADTYEAEFQRVGKLYLTGKSNAFRTIFSVAVFLTVLTMTKDLVTASFAAVLAQIAGFFVFDSMIIRELPNIDWSCGKKKRWLLLKDNTLLFFSVILDFYIFSASKYAVESCMLDKDMAVYGAIFMPTSVINLVAGFVIRPYMTKLALSWEMKRYDHFKKIIRNLFLIISALTVLAVGGAWLLGIPVLSLLYSNIGYALSSCRPALILIILGGAFNAFMNLFYYALVIMKKQRYIFIGYGAALVVALLISNPFVEHGGLLGGAASYLCLMAVLMVIFAVSAIFFIKKAERRDPMDGE